MKVKITSFKESKKYDVQFEDTGIDITSSPNESDYWYNINHSDSTKFTGELHTVPIYADNESEAIELAKRYNPHGKNFKVIDKVDSYN